MPECTPRDCPLVPRVEALERENARHTETHKEIFTRLNQVERDNAVQNEQYQNILDKLDALAAKVEALEAKPAKRWEHLVGTIISTLVGAFVAWIALGMPGK